MTTKKINESTSKKLEDFIFKNRKTILCVVCVVVVAAAALCVVVGVRDSQNRPCYEHADFDRRRQVHCGI